MSKKTKKEVSVYSAEGEFIRTYSKEVHGKKYRELAEEFAGKVKGRKVKSGAGKVEEPEEEPKEEPKEEEEKSEEEEEEEESEESEDEEDEEDEEEEEEDEDDEEEEEEEEVDLEDLSFDELKEEAKERGVEIKGLRKKTDIIKAIEKAEKKGK